MSVTKGRKIEGSLATCKTCQAGCTTKRCPCVRSGTSCDNACSCKNCENVNPSKVANEAGGRAQGEFPRDHVTVDDSPDLDLSSSQSTSLSLSSNDNPLNTILNKQSSLLTSKEERESNPIVGEKLEVDSILSQSSSLTLSSDDLTDRIQSGSDLSSYSSLVSEEDSEPFLIPDMQRLVFLELLADFRRSNKSKGLLAAAFVSRHWLGILQSNGIFL